MTGDGKAPGRALGHRGSVAVVLLVLGTAALLSYTTWSFKGPRVDESEILHFAVGMLGGDLDPGWYGYGSLNMYVMLGVYWVTYGVLRLAGAVSGVEDFARELFRGGLFFQLGRYVYAVYTTATVAVLATAAWRRHVHWIPISAFLLLTLSSPHLAWDATYVRSDTLLGLFAVGLAVIAARREVTRTTLLVAGALTAAAVTTKFTGVTLALVPVGLAAIGLRRGSVRVRDVGLAVAFTGALSLVFSPYATVWDVAQLVIERRFEGDAAFRYGAPTFVGLGDRLSRTWSQVLGDVGLPLVIAAPFAALTGERTRRLAVSLGVVLLLTGLPFLVSSDLPPYWFIPMAALVRGLGLLGIAAIGRLLLLLRDRRAPGRRWPLAVAVAAAAAVVVPGTATQLQSGLLLFYDDLDDPTNLELARRFLEEERNDAVPILLNGPYLQSTPEVYDPSEVIASKRISRAFIAQRWWHPFLNEVFIGWLDEEYGPSTGTTPQEFRTITALSIRPPKDVGPDDVVTARLQVCTDDRCTPPQSSSVAGGTALDEPGTFRLDTSTDTPRLDLSGLSLSADGTVELVVDVDGAAISSEVYFDSGTGWSPRTRVRVDPRRTTRFVLYDPVPEGEVLELDLTAASRDTDDLSSLVEQPSWFVTTPAIYQRFLRLDVDRLPAERQPNGRRLQQLYQQVVELPVVARFEDGRGTPVSVRLLTPDA